jgi:dethiobiotin synthetase
VTGTDTGVGKTLVACSLLRAFAARGMKAVGMKPVASGAQYRGGALVHDDVERLVEAGNVMAPREHVNPYCFEPPIAPHVAARLGGVTISLERIENSARALAAIADVVIVEGAGGFRVPLGADAETPELAARLALPLVLVVGLRLGCLNHALLTEESIRARGLQLAGWVANHVDPAMAAVEDNVQALSERITAPLLARIAYSSSPNPVSSANAFELALLSRSA